MNNTTKGRKKKGEKGKESQIMHQENAMQNALRKGSNEKILKWKQELNL